jgi:serine/threonine-protein kinase
VPQWDRFIREAGYDPAMLRAATPERSAPVDTDSKFAWLANDGRRIEAAAFHGRPVWFSAKTLEKRGDFSPRGTPADRLAFAMFAAFMIGIPIAGIFLARANIRKKQIDRAGAVRAAVTFGISMLLALMFHAHYPMTFVDEWIMTSWHVAQATFWALITAVFYVALEPLVRRRWPQILIAWTRLIAGRFSDSMVGRDVLMGAAAAVIAALVWHSTYTVTQTTLVGSMNGIGPARWVVFLVGRTVCEALLRGFGMILLLLLMRALVRNDLLASLMTMLLIAASALGDAPGPLGMRVFYAVAASFAAIVLARRCGMLAVMAYAFFLVIQQRMPFTLDPDAWYFGRSGVVLALLLLVVVHAFRVSMGARRWLPRLAFDA